MLNGISLIEVVTIIKIEYVFVMSKIYKIKKHNLG